MKRIIETTEASAIESLLGERVLLMCSSYFYSGKLVAVNDSTVTLSDPAIVYETGKWDASKFADEQRIGTEEWHVKLSAIESFGKAK